MRSMTHWNGNVLCALDIKTTGPNPDEDTLMHLAVLPLDSESNICKDYRPFYLFLEPEEGGLDPIKGADAFLHWVEKLELPSTKYGRKKKILILGHDLSHKLVFIMNWLGARQYEEIFHTEVRDILSLTRFFNDKAIMHFKKAPYPKDTISGISYQLSIESSELFDVLANCRVISRVYNSLIDEGIFG